VKREAFLKALREAGCELKRHGTRHDIYWNPSTGRAAPVPRHTELANTLCRVIRRQLGLTSS